MRFASALARGLLHGAGDFALPAPVRGVDPPDYASGTSIELPSIATFYLSPVWVLTFSEIGDALTAEHLLEPDAHFETMRQRLDGLEKTSTSLNLPSLADVERA